VMAGNTSIMQSLLNELPMWFAHHAATMDAALASHIRETGYEALAICADTTS
jgi:hemerythrin